MKTVLQALAGAVIAAAVQTPVFAQANDYPTRPVEMIVPWPAGGGTDVVARVYAEAARNHFAQPIIVINRPGAIGSIGFSEAAAAKPDGYKVVMATPELLIAPHLGIGRANFEQFVPIARINADPSAITVKADARWRTLDEFLAYAKAHPGELTVSTSGSGAVPDIAALAIEEKAGIKFTRVPYQGEAPAIQAIVAGQVDATVVAPSALTQYVRAGKLRVLGVTSAERIAEFSDAPTFKERGVDVAIGTWRGLMVQKGTPPAIVKQWAELTRKVSSEPKYLETLKNQNVKVIYEDGDKLAQVLRENNELFKRLVPNLQVSSK